MNKIFIEARVDKIGDGGCWLWTKSRISVGYGDFRQDGKHWLAHRAAYEAFIGPIPDGLHVLHKCDVRLCCNPEHLFVGTNRDNIADSMAKGRRRGITRVRPSGLIYNWTKKPGPPLKLSKDEMTAVTREYDSGRVSTRALAAKYCVSQGTICRVLGEKYA